MSCKFMCLLLPAVLAFGPAASRDRLTVSDVTGTWIGLANNVVGLNRNGPMEVISRIYEFQPYSPLPSDMPWVLRVHVWKCKGVQLRDVDHPDAVGHLDYQTGHFATVKEWIDSGGAATSSECESTLGVVNLKTGEYALVEREEYGTHKGTIDKLDLALTDTFTAAGPFPGAVYAEMSKQSNAVTHPPLEFHRDFHHDDVADKHPKLKPQVI